MLKKIQVALTWTALFEMLLALSTFAQHVRSHVGTSSQSRRDILSIRSSSSRNSCILLLFHHTLDNVSLK
jgi:hypothetical protein